MNAQHYTPTELTVLKASPSSQFELAAGSVPGRRHTGCGNLLGGKNNQDAIGFYTNDDCIIATVHDGCGSTPYAEFGARLSANIVPLAILEAMRAHGIKNIGQQQFWCDVRRTALKRMMLVAELCCPDNVIERNAEPCRDSARKGDPQDAQVLPNHEAQASCLPAKGEFARTHLLSTILGVVISQEASVVFGIGDGVFAINGKITSIGPFQDNAPDYLCRSLISPVEAPEFVLHAKIRTDKLQSIILGTDGVQDLIAAEEKRIPGKLRTVGSIRDLMQQDFLYSSLTSDGAYSHGRQLDSLTGWLRQVNSEVTKISHDDENNAVIKREEGLLPDDTSLLILRRTPFHRTS